jgi:hypothetical protein
MVPAENDQTVWICVFKRFGKGLVVFHIPNTARKRDEKRGVHRGDNGADEFACIDEFTEAKVRGYAFIRPSKRRDTTDGIRYIYGFIVFTVTGLACMKYTDFSRGVSLLRIYRQANRQGIHFLGGGDDVAPRRLANNIT